MSTSIQAAVRAAIEAGYLPEVCVHMSDTEIVELLLSAVREYDDVIGHFLLLTTQQWKASKSSSLTTCDPIEDGGTQHQDQCE